MIVQEVFGIVNRKRPERSEGLVERGLGVQGKGAAAPLPLLPLCRRQRSFLGFVLRWVGFLAHRLSAHFDAVGIVNQTVEDAIGDGGIPDLLMPS